MRNGVNGAVAAIRPMPARKLAPADAWAV